MKLVNADYGLDVVVKDEHPRQKWYYWHRFPLLPIFDYSRGDEYNEANFNFSWLMLRVWSLMSPSIEISIVFEDVGAYLAFRVPYLRIIIWFLWFPSSWHQKLWRKPAIQHKE